MPLTSRQLQRVDKSKLRQALRCATGATSEERHKAYKQILFYNILRPGNNNFS